MTYSCLANSGLINHNLAFGAMTFDLGTLVGKLRNNIYQPMGIEAKTAEADDE